MQNKLKQVTDAEFKAYGKVLTGYDFTQLFEKMEATPVPDEVIYEPGIEELEALPISKELSKNFYGQMPIQVGYCNGYNDRLEALEYHRSSEINIAVTDMILELGKQQDVLPDNTYDSRKTEAFFVPAGTALELYATTLHYAPASVNGEKFKCVVVLPEGTNHPLEDYEIKCKEDEILVAKNKWLIRL